MENIFSFKRFWLLVRKHAKDNWKLFLVLIISLNIPVLVSYFSNLNNVPNPLSHNNNIILVLIGCVYTGSFFRNWTHTSRAASFLMLPATTFEKIALVIFYAVILYIPVCTIVSFGSYFTVSKMFNIGKPFTISDILNQITSFKVFFNVLLVYTFYQSLFLLMSVWFKKKQFLMALIVIFISIITVFFLNKYYIQWLTGNTWVGITPFSLFHSRIEYHQIGHSSEITSNLIANVNILIYSMMTILFYIASYFKLKEKEI